MLAHEAYLDTLRSIRSTTAEWRAVVAGFLVLRLVDGWLDEHGPLVTRDTAAVYAVREALSGMRDRDPGLPMLRELVDIVIQSERRDRLEYRAVIDARTMEGCATLYENNQWTVGIGCLCKPLESCTSCPG